LQTLDLRPGKAPESELDGGQGNEGSQVLEVLGETVSSEQEKARSTTQRRGKTTKPFMSSLRLTISMRSTGTPATGASTCPAL
jgi:hypothetical protein